MIYATDGTGYKIDFSTATRDELTAKGIASLDFLALIGSDVKAVCIGDAEDNCGQAAQDGTVWMLDGAEVRYATLTNGGTIWSDTTPYLYTGD